MKKILIISSSPNDDGLTAACASSAEKGSEEAGASVKKISLNDMNIQNCRACGNGWGICRTQHNCIINDDFSKIQDEISQCDSLIIVTPVYWGEMSEISKSFFDRFRRCEASKHFGENTDIISALYDKNVVLIAAAGGSGNGTLSCLSQMENLVKHVRGKIFDRITVTRFNRSYKLVTIKQAGYEVVNPEVLK